MKKVFETGGPSCFEVNRSMIVVEQSGAKKGLFRVSYGLQVRDNLTYAQCAKELGECILHDLSCEGIVNNAGL